MRMYKKIIALAVILIGMTGWAGDSVPFLLDTTEPLVETGEEVLFSYNSSWIGGDPSAEVVISADGTEIKRTTGEGEFAWSPTSLGKHTLTYTTYIDGVQQDEVYEASVYVDWKYAVEDGNAILQDFVSTDGVLDIPSEIDGFPVVGFVDGLFDGCTNLTQVVIPGNRVAKMSDIFPDSYDKLTSVTLTGDVTEIPQDAFAGCVALESFVIPDAVKKIGANAFSGCSSLSEVVIPDSVYSMGVNAFLNCTRLMKVTMPFLLKEQVESGNVFTGCSENLEIVYRAAEIKNVVAKQRFPWNGKIDVSFDIEGNALAGFFPNNLPSLVVTAEDRKIGEKYIASNASLSGDIDLTTGTHKIVWDLKSNGYEFKSDDIVISVALGIPSIEGLISQYLFNDDLCDSSSNNYDLSGQEGCFVADRKGVDNGAYSFNGAKQSITSTDCRLETEFTFAFWFKTSVSMSAHGTGVDTSGLSGWYGNYVLFPRNCGSDVGFGLKIGTDGISVIAHGDVYLQEQLGYSANIGTGWNHIAVSVSSDGAIGIYLNGVCVKTGTKSSSRKSIFVPNVGGGSYGYYTGCIDELLVFDKELDADIIALIYSDRVFAKDWDAIYEGESSSILVDTYPEPLFEMGVDKLSYNSSWVGGNPSAEVVIAADGTEIKRATGEGDFTWEAAPGKHTLTYTTYIDGVAQEEVYTATVFKDWKYTVEDGKATIIETTQTSGVVTIPSEIDGYPVAGLGEGLFNGYEGLMSVTIPDSVYSIGAKAFKNCSNLTNVSMPLPLKGQVEDGDIFAGCSEDLEIVYRSAEITNVVAKQRFPWNGKVDITYNVTGNIGAGLPEWSRPVLMISALDRTKGSNYVAQVSALSGDTGIEEGEHHIVWDFNAQNLQVKSDDMVFTITYSERSTEAVAGAERAGEILYFGLGASVKIDSRIEPVVEAISYNSSWIGGDSSAEVVITDNGTEIKRAIGEGEFAWATTPGKHTLTYTTYINGVAQDEVYTATVFKDWKYRVSDGKATIVETTKKSGSVTIPSEIDGLPVVGFVDGLFDGCTNLTQVVIPGNCVAKMSDIFPDSYDKLTSVTLTGDVTEIPQDAFAGCESLESFIIPNGVTMIGASAFDGCSSLSEIVIPDSVYTIGVNAFLNCTRLTKVTMPFPLKEQVESGNVFDGCSENLEIVYRGAEIKNVVAKQRFPWNGKVNITYNVTGNIAAGLPEWSRPVLMLSALDRTTGSNYVAQIKALSGDTGIEEGEHHIVWDLNAQDLHVKSDDTVFTITYSERSTEAVAGAERAGEILYFASAASTKIDSRIEPLVDSIYVSYKSAWIGGEESAEVVISADGTEIKRTTGEGEFAWSPTTAGKHILTYTTYINGVAQDEVYEATVYADWKYVVEDGKATIIETTQISGDVVIPSEIDGCPVVCLKEGLFAGCDGLTSVLVPDSVDKIGENVFKDCTDLKSITIRLAVEGAAENLPNDVPLTLILDNNDQRLPDRLRNCVRKVIFSDGITRIADDFFLDCNNLETIDIPQSVIAIGRNVFNFCSSLNIVTQDGFKLYQGWCLGYEGADNSTLKIPEGVLGIAADAFKGMTSLKSVTFPSSLRFIGADAFAGCTQLAELTLPDNIVEIADGAFRDCTWVQNVKMSSNLERIGSAAFANCAYLPNVVCADGLEEIGVGAFSNCWRMTSVSLPASLDSVGCDAFWNCKNLGGVTVPAHVQPLAEMLSAAYSALSSIIIAEGETELCEGAFEGCASVTKIDIPEVITNIPARAFKNCTNFDRLVLPSGLLAIGDEAFYGCSKIENLTLPKNLISIGAGAFNGWALLDVVTIPDGVTFIGSGAFAGCAAVRQVRMPSNVATVSATFPDAYTEIVRVMIPNNSTGIIAGFLNGCTSIPSFDIPSSVTEIGNNAFRSCKNLSGISLPDGLDKIGSYAFYGCTLIDDLTIPSSVTAIGYNAFGSCAQIRSVVISGEAGTLSSLFPNAYQQIVSVTVLSGSEKLMNRIFAGCKSLKNVDIPTSVTEIGEGAFEGCTALTSAGIPAGVTVLGKGAFRGCSTLTEITLPNGLSVLEDEVFSGCSLLSAITIPESVIEIGSKVFNGCSALHSVKFVGNAPLADVESYTGVSSSLITYVPYASMGWDGISTSMALPEFWPVGYENTIEWWDPIRFDVTFDWNCEAGEAEVIEQVVDTTYILPDVDPTREGAAFAGWWTAKMDGARITPASRVMLTTPHTLYAHWRMNTYSVVFDANGGTGAMDPMDLTVNKPAVLTACGFTRFDSDFAGWAIEPEGEVLYRDCAEVSNLTLESDAVVTLYAVWTPRTWTEGDYLNQPGLVFASEGDAPWVTDAEVCHDGIASLRSGAIGASAEYPDRTCSTIKTTVVGEGTGSFWWKVHCEEMDAEYGDWFDYAVFTVDGVEIAKIAGDTDWTKVTYSVTGSGEHELVWTFTRDDYDLEDAEWLNAAWLDELVWSPKMVALKFDAGGATGDVPESILRQEGDTVLLPGAGTLVKGTDIFKGWSDGTTLYIPGSEYTFGSEDETLTAVWEEKVWTLAEAADAVALVMTTGGTADWTVDATTGYTNMVCVKSGVVTSGQESWIETKVNGSGKLTFRWNVMGGVYRNQPFAYAKVEVDGVEISSEYLTDGWEKVVYEITGVEEHTIRWTYLRTSTRAADGDCAWIDAVVWTPASSSDITVDVDGDKNIVVPASWIDKYESIVTSAGGDKAAALQRTAANGRKVWECFMLGVDPTKADDDFKITRFWMEGGKPMFEFSHSTDGAGNSFTPRLKVKGKAKLSDGWSDVPDGGNSAFRFFTVEVALP